MKRAHEGDGVGKDLEREYVDYVRARLPRLRRMAYLLCGDVHRADDVVQSTVTNLYVHWRQVRAADSLDAYVHTMLVRTFLSEHRRPWSRVRLTAAPPERAADGDGSAVDERLVVRAALRRLPRRQQAVLVLRFLCDLSVADAATLLGCSTGTVKSQTSDGLAALRKVLGPARTNYGGVR
jgi:RNA polymerase sigma-70 factor (sigma-E family)